MAKQESILTTDRSILILPHSEEAERAVLGAILSDGKCIVEVYSLITEYSFYDTRHSLIYKGMKSLYENSKEIDLITVTEELIAMGRLEACGGGFYLTSLCDNIVTTSNIISHANIVKKNETLRLLIKHAENIASKSFSPDADPKEILNEHTQKIFELATSNHKRTILTPLQLAEVGVDYLERIIANPHHAVGLETGHKNFDGYVGGLFPSIMIVVGACTGMGKTSYALDVSTNIAKTKPVLYFSMDMDKIMIAIRYISKLSGVDAEQIRTGRFGQNEINSLMNLGCAGIADSQFYLDDLPTLNANQLHQSITQFMIKHPDLALVVIDNLNNVDFGKGENKNQKVTEFTWAVSRYAKEFGIPIMLLSQLNRSSTKGRLDPRPILSDLRESGAIEQDARLVIGLYREKYFKPDQKDNHSVEIIILKNNMGRTGKIPMIFDEHTCTFKDALYQNQGNEPKENYYESEIV